MRKSKLGENVTKISDGIFMYEIDRGSNNFLLDMQTNIKYNIEYDARYIVSEDIREKIDNKIRWGVENNISKDTKNKKIYGIR